MDNSENALINVIKDDGIMSEQKDELFNKLSLLRDANGDLTALDQAATDSDNQTSDQDDNGLVVHDDDSDDSDDSDDDDFPLAALVNRS